VPAARIVKGAASTTHLGMGLGQEFQWRDADDTWRQYTGGMGDTGVSGSTNTHFGAEGGTSGAAGDHSHGGNTGAAGSGNTGDNSAIAMKYIVCHMWKRTA
jgi:hypothetical protein